jgi:nucleotide-binding universal stress UspA family protein
MFAMSEGMTKAAPRIVVGVDVSPRRGWRCAGPSGRPCLPAAISAFQVTAGMPAYARDRDPSAWMTPPDARTALDAVISEKVAPDEGRRVTARVLYGHPAEVLLDAAADADLP